MRNVTTEDTYNGYPLCSSSKNNEGFYVEILEAIESLLRYTTDQHGRVFFTMFVVKYPTESYWKYPNDNALFSKFIEGLIRHYKNKPSLTGYVWARECSSTGQLHYHFALLLDSNLFQNGFGILTEAIDRWGRCLGIEDAGGLVQICTSGGASDKYGGTKLIGSDPLFQGHYAKCFQHASYLAKCYSKGNSPPYVREFGCSQIPRFEFR